VLAIPTILWLFIYGATNLYMHLRGPVDLKKKYNAEWALVTGAVTGIGKSLADYGTARLECGLGVLA